MALIDTVLGTVFGGGRNVLRETAEVFRENAEERALRDMALKQAALSQFGAEFTLERQGWFNRLVDGANRLPRPLMAMGTLALFASAMVDPVWFASRMQGIALVPEPLWWLLGAIVSFYFGARHQAKGQEFQIRVAQTMAHVPQVVSNLSALKALEEGGSVGQAETPAASTPQETAAPDDDNPALMAWRRSVPQAGTHADPVGGR
ncbi:MAG: holin family protein [Rhodobacterales bacterium]